MLRLASECEGGKAHLWEFGVSILAVCGNRVRLGEAVIGVL